jgi:methylenetetrahydrofolate reductase (NADPH)
MQYRGLFRFAREAPLSAFPYHRRLSFEVAPPLPDEPLDPLLRVAEELARHEPVAFAVTNDQRGIPRQLPFATAAAIRRVTGRPVLVHWRARQRAGNTPALLLDELARYDLTDVLIIGGDPYLPEAGVELDRTFRRTEEALVALRARAPAEVRFYAAAHPRRPPITEDRRISDKLRSGAEGFITQAVFSVQEYQAYRDRQAARGISAVIIPGILPISSAGFLERLTTLKEIRVPEHYAEQFAGKTLREATRLGGRLAARLARELFEAGAPVVHIFNAERPRLMEWLVRELQDGAA